MYTGHYNILSMYVCNVPQMYETFLSLSCILFEAEMQAVTKWQNGHTH